MSKIKFKTLRENVVDVLRKRITTMEYKPGERIIEQHLSDEFGISRGPIREALRQLEEEGLVEYTRNAGCHVRKTSIEDVYELYLLRAEYEILAVRIYAGKLSSEDIKLLETILKEMEVLKAGDIMKAVELDNAFHQVVIRPCELATLMKSWSNLNSAGLLASLSGESQESIARRQYSIHKEIYDAFHDGRDADSIGRLLMKHYMAPIKTIMEANGIDTNRYYFSFE